MDPLVIDYRAGQVSREFIRDILAETSTLLADLENDLLYDSDNRYFINNVLFSNTLLKIYHKKNPDEKTYIGIQYPLCFSTEEEKIGIEFFRRSIQRRSTPISESNESDRSALFNYFEGILQFYTLLLNDSNYPSQMFKKNDNLRSEDAVSEGEDFENMIHFGGISKRCIIYVKENHGEEHLEDFFNKEFYFSPKSLERKVAGNSPLDSQQIDALVERFEIPYRIINPWSKFFIFSRPSTMIDCSTTGAVDLFIRNNIKGFISEGYEYMALSGMAFPFMLLVQFPDLFALKLARWHNTVVQEGGKDTDILCLWREIKRNPGYRSSTDQLNSVLQTLSKTIFLSHHLFTSMIHQNQGLGQGFTMEPHEFYDLINNFPDISFRI